LDNILTNGCLEKEGVHLIGEGRLVTWLNPKPIGNGTMIVRQRLQLAAEGEGLVSAAHYDYVEQARIKIYDGVPLPFAYTERRTQTLFGDGVPDQLVSFKVRLVIDANGDVKTDLFDFQLSCQ
jgi:hypothetical protein